MPHPWNRSEPTERLDGRSEPHDDAGLMAKEGLQAWKEAREAMVRDLVVQNAEHCGAGHCGAGHCCAEHCGAASDGAGTGNAETGGAESGRAVSDVAAWACAKGEDPGCVRMAMARMQNRFPAVPRISAEKSPRGLLGVDAGSGSLLGVMLIIGVACCLTVLTLVGDAMVVSAQARSAADMAALAAASAVKAGEGDPCQAAVDNALSVEATVVECRIVDEDAMVSVSRRMLLPFLPPIEQRSRAGPEFCDEV